MAATKTCIYRFGEFEASEFFLEEFLFGYEDCSEPFTEIDCNKVMIYPKPYLYSQWNNDKEALEDYVRKTLTDSIKEHNNKSKIGKSDNCILYLNIQTKALIEYLLYFKQELELNPTVDNYNKLFTDYKIKCIDNQWKCNYRLNTWIKDMLQILNLGDLINLYGINGYLYKPLVGEPLYYIYNGGNGNNSTYYTYEK